MGLVTVGLSHHTAPVEVRERLAVPEAELDETLRKAAAVTVGEAGEAMLVSTCNRVELYLVAADEAAARARAVTLLARAGRSDGPGFDPASLSRYLYTHSGATAAHHLFRVASSLDSLVVGEPQILGQVKEAYERAVRAGVVGPLLGRLVPRVFGAAKRVRSETAVARASSSVASAAVELARQIFGDLEGRDVLVLGAGKMGTLAARHLLAAGCARLLLCNRTVGRAEELAARLMAEQAAEGSSEGAGSDEEAPRPRGKRAAKLVTEAHPLEALPSLLQRADIALCSTGAGQPVIGRELVQRVMKARKGRWLCLLDIAVPRDVEPSAGDVENVYLYDVDRLTEMVDGNLAERRREAEAGERILAEELERWQRSESARGVVPTIKLLREHFAAVARAEAARTLGKLNGASEKDRREVQLLADAIVNKLLHAPLTALKRDAESEPLVTAVHALFQLNEATPAAASPIASAASGGDAEHIAVDAGAQGDDDPLEAARAGTQSPSLRARASGGEKGSA